MCATNMAVCLQPSDLNGMFMCASVTPDRFGQGGGHVLKFLCTKCCTSR